MGLLSQILAMNEISMIKEKLNWRLELCVIFIMQSIKTSIIRCNNMHQQKRNIDITMWINKSNTEITWTCSRRNQPNMKRKKKGKKKDSIFVHDYKLFSMKDKETILRFH